MRRTVKIGFGKIVRMAVVLFIFIWTCNGCAQLGQVFEKSPAAEEEPVSAAEGESKAPGEVQQGQPSSRGTEQPPEHPPYYLHTVRWSGESLSIIAEWYTGDLKHWELLADANPALDPDRIFPGDTIRIPSHLVKTQSPMPRAFVDSHQPIPEEKTLPSQPAPQPDTDEDLFGPKE